MLYTTEWCLYATQWLSALSETVAVNDSDALSGKKTSVPAQAGSKSIVLTCAKFFHKRGASRPTTHFILQRRRHDEEIPDRRQSFRGGEKHQGLAYSHYSGERDEQVDRLSVQAVGMSDPRISTSGGGSGEAAGSRTRSQVPGKNRRQGVRFGYKPVRVHRPQRVLLASSTRRATDKEGDRTTYARVQASRGSHTAHQHPTPGARKDTAVHRVGSTSDAGECDELHGMLSLSIRARVSHQITTVKRIFVYF